MEHTTTNNGPLETRVPLIIGICSFFIFVLLVCVSLRFYARKVAGVGYWWDDWFCLVGMPFGIMVSVIDIIATHRGLGHHAADLNPDDIERYLKTLYIVLLFYNPGLAFFKWSFLAFYIRVFPVVKSLRVSCYIVGTLVLLWVLGTQFSFVFQCAPISAAWTGKGKCIKTSHIYIAQSVPTLVFDLVILALPVKTIWNAQLKTAQKWSVMGVFLLGGLVTVISIVRLVTTLTSTDQDLTWGYIDLGIWSAAEPVIGLLSCCLLTYGPLVIAFRRRVVTSISGDSQIGTKGAFSRHDAPESGMSRSNNGYKRHPNNRDDADSETFELTHSDNKVPATSAISRANCESTDAPGRDLETQRRLTVGQIHVRQEYSVIAR